MNTELLKAFFKRTGKVKNVEWSENIYVPIKKTVQPDVRLNYTETFEHINKELTNN